LIDCILLYNVQTLSGARRPAVTSSAFVGRQSLNDEELVRTLDSYLA